VRSPCTERRTSSTLVHQLTDNWRSLPSPRTVLHPGANHASLSLPSTLPAKTAFLLLQNEIPLDQTKHYLSLASAAGASAVFNPSPMPTAAQIRAFEWGKLGWLVVNEGEMQALLAALPEAAASAAESAKGIESEAVPEKLRPLLPELYRLASHPLLRSDTPPGLILTLGAAGSVTLPPNAAPFHTPSAPLQGSYRDTTGAGDTFLGFFVGSLMRGLDVREAVRRATRAAGMAVEREGAMEAVPSWEEVEARLAADNAK
jgi:ribokinase